MTTTVGEIKTTALHKMREFSIDGTAKDDNDYLLSMVPLINFHQKVLARDTKCINRRHKISHSMPDNQLGKYTWHENEIHDDEDVSYSAQGSKGYSFQFSSYALAYIEESADQVTWSNLYTITKTLATLTVTDGITPVVTTLDGSTEYLSVKGKTNLSDDDYYVRIRFGGTYRYLYRWVALFEENFYDDDAVPQFSPFVPYDLPTNYYAVNRVTWTHEYEQKEDYNKYRFEEEEDGNIIFIEWYEEGEFTIEYYASPTKITLPVLPTLDSQDATLVDIPDEVVPQLIELVASDLLSNESDSRSRLLKQDAYIGINQINDQDDRNQGKKRVVNESNW